MVLLSQRAQAMCCNRVISGRLVAFKCVKKKKKSLLKWSGNMGVTCKTIRFVGNGMLENSQLLSKDAFKMGNCSYPEKKVIF